MNDDIQNDETGPIIIIIVKVNGREFPVRLDGYKNFPTVVFDDQGGHYSDRFDQKSAAMREAAEEMGYRITDIGVPGGFTEDREDYNRAMDAAMDAEIAHMLSDIMGEPLFFDRSGSMSDDMLRDMTTEVHSIMDSTFAREARDERHAYERMMVLRLEDDCIAGLRKHRMYLPQRDNGAPRSIKETRRAQGRGSAQNAMSNWKRK